MSKLVKFKTLYGDEILVNLDWVISTKNSVNDVTNPRVTEMHVVDIGEVYVMQSQDDILALQAAP